MVDEPLSPAHLLALLPASLQIDCTIAAGFTLVDCFRLADHEPLRLELRRGDPGTPAAARLEIVVAPRQGEGPPPLLEVAGLALGYRRPAPEEAAREIAQVFAGALRGRLGPEFRCFRLLPPTPAHLPPAIAAEIEVVPARLADDPDGVLLGLDADHHAACYGVRPTAVEVRVGGRPIDGLSIHTPAPPRGRVPPSAAVYPLPAQCGLRRRLRAHFAGLGFVVDDALAPRTVPTPTTFARALADRPGLARLRPRLVAGRGPTLLARTWASHLRRDVLPISVAPTWAVRVHRLVRRIPGLAAIPCDVGMLVHDMGLHALGLHAIPADAWEALSARAFARVGGGRSLARLARFFEGSLTRASWEAWKECDAPADFAAAFGRRVAALEAEVAAL